MTHDIDQIHESFAAHEHLAPDAESVLARAGVIARSYHRRRWAVRATGGAVLAGGLVAGGIALPGQSGHSSPGGQAIAAAAASSPSPSTSAGKTYTQAQELSEYFAKGYDYTDAQELAKVWNSTGDITGVKAAAGLKLLEGESLPVTPDVAPESPVPSSVSAFFNAGYDYNDAVQLGKLWNISNTYTVKGDAGQKLLDGQTLPIPPSGPPVSSSSSALASGGSVMVVKKKAMLKAMRAQAKARGQVTGSTDVETVTPAQQAYFAAGYDYNDALSLGKIWNETDIGAIKTEAGQKLLDGDTLPVKPSGTAESTVDTAQQKDVDAFFAAGYDYNDAVKLGKLWNISDTYTVKGDAGKKLLEGQTLPIAP